MIRKSIGKAFLRIGEIMALGYDAGDSTRFRKDMGWGRSNPQDEDSLTGRDYTREKIRQKASDLYRNNAIIAGIGNRIASFTLGHAGLLPQCKTSSREWNKAAEDYWAQWSKIADSRQRLTLRDIQWLSVSLRPVHGGLYLQILDNGQVRPIECERIRQPTDTDKAKVFSDGVRVDPKTGIILGYQVHARDGDGGFSGEHSEEFIPRENVIPIIRPSWRPDQVREIPDLAPIVPTMQDIQEMNTYTLNTAKTQSMIISVLKTLRGDLGGPRGSTPSVGTRETFKQEWGQTLKLFPGEDLELKSSPTPSAMHIPYIKLQLMLAAAALDFPYEFFTLDFSTADYSRMKAVLLLSNKSIRNWQSWLMQPMTRLWNWRIAKAIKAGDLPPAPAIDGVSQWFRVEWQPPEEAWVDRQEANQADMMEWQLGLGPLSNAAKRRGGDLEDKLREKADNLKMAADIEKEYGLPPGTLIKAQIPGQTEPAVAPAQKPAQKVEVEDGESA